MRKFLTLLSIFTVLIHANVNSQQLTQTIRGQVIDKDSETSLPSATVIILNSYPLLGTTTDLDGYFTIEKVPVGRHSVKISFLGYEDLIVPEILVGSGKEIFLNIELQESLVKIEEIKVIYKRPKDKPINNMSVVSSRTFTVEETSRYAASIDDPSRMALSFAGVTIGGEDARNDLVIRGNSPRGMLWKIEGIPVYSPNHFTEEGTSGGGINIISNNLLDNSDFMTGAWSAEYGNATSGVFDIKLRRGNNQKQEYAAQLSTMGVDFVAEGPFKKGNNSSYLVNYRYSTLAILDAVGISLVGEDEGVPKYQDLSFKLFMPTKKSGIFTFWGIGGLSEIGTESVVDTAFTYDTEEYNYIENDGERFKSNLGIMGLNHKYFMNEKTYIQSALSLSTRHSRIEEDGRLDPDLAMSRIGVELEEDFKSSQYIFSSLLNTKFSAKHTLKTGLNFIYQNYQTLAIKYNFDTKFFCTEVNEDGNSNLQSYIQSKYSFSKKIGLYSGLHFSYFALNNKNVVEPRIALEWNMSKKQSLTFGYGLHSQLQALPLYLIKVDNQKVNKNLDFTKAHHYVVSYNNMFSDDLRLKLDLYYQDLYNIPIAKNPETEYLQSYSVINDSNEFTYTALENKGTGVNYGIELTLEKFLSNNWYMLLTTSLYQSKYKAADGIERDTRYNGKYIFNLLAGKEFKVRENNVFSVNTRIIRSGGKRYTPVKSERVLTDDNDIPVISPVTGKEIIFAPDDHKNAFTNQFKDYFRIDLSFAYRINRPKIAHIISFDVQNLFDVENQLKVDFYNTRTDQFIFNYQAGIFPALKYKIEF